MKLTRSEKEAMRKLGSRGGKRSLQTMTAEQRKERAKKAVAAREKKRKKEKGGGTEWD